MPCHDKTDPPKVARFLHGSKNAKKEKCEKNQNPLDPILLYGYYYAYPLTENTMGGYYEEIGKPMLICDECDHMVSYLEATDGTPCFECERREDRDETPLDTTK